VLTLDLLYCFNVELYRDTACLHTTITIVLSFIENMLFRRLDSVSVFRWWYLLGWAQQIELVYVYGPFQLRRYHLKGGTESSLRKVVF
jgi:hypothetical protein